jgi:flagellar biosynthetic protein FliP
LSLAFGSQELHQTEGTRPKETKTPEKETKMEIKIGTNGTEPVEPAALAVTGEVLESTETASPETGGQVLRYVVTGWHFTRHLLEMVVAMMAGMMVLGVAVGILGEPAGEVDLLVEYGVMGAFMSAPMVAWMRYRGHSWYDGMEMTAAMVAPMFALVIPVELGVVVLTGHSLMVLSHVAMIGGMILLMLYRLDRYAHVHDHTGHTTTKETE